MSTIIVALCPRITYQSSYYTSREDALRGHNIHWRSIDGNAVPMQVRDDLDISAMDIADKDPRGQNAYSNTILHNGCEYRAEIWYDYMKGAPNEHDSITRH